MTIKFLVITVFMVATLSSSGCAWINAAGKAYEGAGEGLEEASAEEAEGSFNHRIFNLAGSIGKAVGKILQNGAKKEESIRIASVSNSIEPVDTELIQSIQRRLYELEMLDTQPDGIAGAETIIAIKQYQKQHSLLVDGRVSRALWDHIK